MVTIAINKEFFESTLAVATSASMQVYEKCTSAIEESADNVATHVLGEAITENALSANPMVLYYAKQLACLNAFQRVLRQLDLVLTPTGFGVVANNTTSPASAQRVDALDKAVWHEGARAYSHLLSRLRLIDGWGTQSVAEANILHPAFDFCAYERLLGRKAEQEEWSQFLGICYSNKALVQRYWGRGQWNGLMDKVRCYSEDNKIYNEAARRITEIVYFRATMSPLERMAFTDFKDFVEDNLETFAIYANSKEYKANHYEPYRNTKDSSAFFFAG